MRYFCIVVVGSAAVAASVAVVYFTLNYAKETSIKKREKSKAEHRSSGRGKMCTEI